MPVHDDEERRTSPLFNITLSSEQILDAFSRSPDNGVTLFLSKLGICEMGSREVEELATAGHEGYPEQVSVVERLALGYNRLISLPLEFELFTRLRYLNLKHNLLPTFPSVLTQLPCLDILDVSHNKIRSLPLYPGNLTQLHVFCLSKNKISRLPTYLYQFRQLDVLQVDRNPIEWPPQSVMTQLGNPIGIHNAKEWISKLQNWLEVDQAKDKEYEDSGYSEQRDWEPNSSYDSWKFPTPRRMSDAGLTPHARSFSIDSVSSIPDSPFLNGLDNINQTATTLSNSGRSDNETTTMPSFGSSSADTFYIPSPTTSKARHHEPEEAEQMHVRTMSYATALRKPQGNSMVPKHSLPDLRFAHKAEREKVPPLPYFPQSGKLSDEPPFHHSTLQVQEVEPTSSLQTDYSRISDGRSHPFVAAERSSYFQRSLSTSSTHLPRPVACLIETARSILFSMGQLHHTLDRCARHGAFERASPVFRKALDPANMTMLHLIRSLDRFDDVSQQSLPSTAVCRGLVECCRDTMGAYRKALALLTNQISQEPPADVRFTRWLVLELYGVHSEISVAWQAMTSEVEHLRPFIYNNLYSQLSVHSATRNHVVQLQELKPAGRLRSIDNGITAAGRVGKTRRHAGSFSSKDVEIGKDLPSYDIIPSGIGRLASHTLTPILRIPKRQFTAPAPSTPSSSQFPMNHSFPFPPQVEHIHIPQYSQSSLYDSPSLISPTASLESPASSRPSIDQDIKQALQTAVEIAPIVWDHFEKVLNDTLMVDHVVREVLNTARAVTADLARNVAGLYEDGSDRDRKHLRENAYLFLKIVLQLSNILKTHAKPRSITPSLRSDMIKLVKATQEFASFSQGPSISSTPRSSPPTTLPKISAYKTSVYSIQDNQLGSSLSRARSAQPPSTSSAYSAQTMSPTYDNLQPILPLSIKTPNSRRTRATRQVSVDSTDPG